MTNSDRLQEIRERVQLTRETYPNNGTILLLGSDLDGLLQLVTEQQREIERLQNYHEALTELKEHIEAIAAADKDEWKASGLEAVATMLRMWHIEGVQEMKQELRALKNPPSTDEAKGYRKQERPI